MPRPGPEQRIRAISANRKSNLKLVLARCFLLLSAVLHLYYGVVFALDPEPMMARLALAATAAAGITEMRAFHGGLMIALGCAFLWAALDRRWLRPGLVLMALTYMGAVIGRSAGILIDGTGDAFIHSILMVETVGFLLSVFSLWLIRYEHR